ncbi:acrosin-binding protein isoform X3 [Crotalus tigris]|uniref:acrosin-binding protein isoform X3 n=1 Tax=Crotalus tigris TaxID=88082 RepID=UPI00192F4EB0|nr:acrosin-binding protein isoform X3 [Crotalus tigris]
MPVLRFRTSSWAFLVGFPIFLIPAIPSSLSSNPGSPLTDNEYKVFFSSLRPTWKANLVCQIRRNKGCHDPKIIELDQFENHGQIPEGPVCAELPQSPHFETFCIFAQFRCLNQKFYTKRILCPKLPLLEETDVLPTAPISGQEPLMKKDFHVPHSNLEAQQLPEWSTGLDNEMSTFPPETFTLFIKNDETTEEITNQHLFKDIHHLIGEALSLEKNLKEKSMKDKNLGLNSEKDISGSLLAIDKDEALVILCYAVLQDICISSAISRAWKEIERKNFGSEDLVCDNLGRHHADLCAECAFCSLKTEQCQGASNLKRTHCSDGIFTNYINPGILAQHRARSLESSPNTQEFYGFETYGGMRTEYWCGRLAAHGCDDYRVAFWLQSEYSFFHGGDFPEKICDSTGVQHPTYCAFKSNQCTEYTIQNKKVLRIGCLKDQMYRELSREEGEVEVLLWSQKFLNFTEG